MEATLDITSWLPPGETGSLGTTEYFFSFASNETHSVCINPAWASYQVDISATYEAPGCTERIYSLNDATISNSTQNVNLYLLSDSSSALINFIVINSLGSAIPNALVTVQKSVGGNWTTMTSGYTDSTGNAAFYLDVSTQYMITVQAAGYSSMSNLLTPSNPPYMFTMSNAGTGTYQTAWSWITYSIPPYRGLYANSTETINLTITDDRRDLALFGMSIAAPNGTVVFSQEVTTLPSGGQIFGSINLTGAAPMSQVMVTMWFQRSGYSTQTITKNYVVFSPPGSAFTLSWVFTELGAQFDPFQKAFISILVTMAVMVVLSLALPSLPKEGLAYVGLGVLGIFAWGQWFNPIWFIILCFITLGLKLLGGKL